MPEPRTVTTTPGPWPDINRGGDCIQFGPNGSWEIKDNHECETDADYQLANTAPDLLEACKAGVTLLRLKSLAPSTRTTLADEAEVETEDVIAEMKSAIARAEPKL